jgi:hypothetical protein
MRSDIKRAALTGGVIWAVIMFFTTLAGVYFGYGIAFLNVWVSIYPGYSISLLGSVIGLVYGFLDMFIGIYLIAWVYKKLSKYA